MDANLTVQSVIEYFEDKLRHQEGAISGSKSGSAPQYPMMVFHLGPCERGAALADGLMYLWPQFRQEIPFLSVKPAPGGAELREFFPQGNGKYAVSPDRVDAGRAADLASGLSSIDRHFRSYVKIVSYFVIDTFGLQDLKAFSACLDAVSQAQSATGISAAMSMSMLIILLDESNSSRQKLAGQIRNLLAQNVSQGSSASVCLVSNRLNDQRIAPPEVCTSLSTAVIAVSNNQDAQTVQDTFFNHSLFTAGYRRAEKPIADICQFMVTRLVNRLSRLQTAGENLPSGRELAQRLGVSQNGTIVTLDRYVQDNFASLLPTPQQLELFPRRSCADFSGSPEAMSASDFNEETMGAWSAYLAGLMAEAGSRLELNRVEMERLAADYGAYLRREFTVRELIWLSEHGEAVDACFASPREPFPHLGTLEYAGEYLKYLLSSNQELRALCRGALDRACTEAAEYLKDWNALVGSMSSLHPIRQGDGFTGFYSGLFNDYYDKQSHFIEDDFKKLSSREGLRKFFTRAVDGMLQDDALKNALCASFVSELTYNDQDDASSLVKKMLVPGQVPVYLQTLFALGAPFRSFLLADSGSLPAALNIPSGIAVYDTGRGSAVEALYLYGLRPDSIMFGGDL